MPNALSLWLALLALAASLVGCRQDEPEDMVDMTSFDRGSSGSIDVLHALAVSDAMFAFDPTLDPTMSAEANAMAVRDHVTGSLGGCASAEVAGSAVTVTFATGCELRNGLTAAGSVTVELTRMAASLTAAVTFDALVVGSSSLDGSAIFTTSNGSSFTVDATLTSGSGMVDADLAVVGTAMAMEVDGTATITREGTATMLAFSNVIWALGDCYPSSGTMTVGVGRVSQTVTFTAATPETGTVTVTQGRATREASLPAYGACPMGA